MACYLITCRKIDRVVRKVYNLNSLELLIFGLFGEGGGGAYNKMWGIQNYVYYRGMQKAVHRVVRQIIG